MNGNVITAVSNRIAGNMSLNYGDTAESLGNRKKFLGALGIEYRDLVCAKQIHGSAIRYVSDSDKGYGALTYGEAIPDVDALVTDKKDIPLAIFTADCLSVFIYDPSLSIIGLVHAGWRGTKESICIKTIKFIREKFCSCAGDLLIKFGPCIRACCYEVSSEFKDLFSDNVFRKDNKYYFDLVAANKAQLMKVGVKEENILDSSICTFCQSSNYFSFRKEKDKSGRMMSVMMLK